MEQTLHVAPRETGLNRTTLKNLRAEGKIPATLFGKSFESSPVFVDSRNSKSRNWHRGSMFTFNWNGQPLRACLNEIQRTAVGSEITHLSFHVIRNDEVIHVDLPIVLKGRAAGERAGALTNLLLKTVSVKGLPDAIPNHIEIDVSHLEVGGHISFDDLKLPKGLTLAQSNPTETVVFCAQPRVGSLTTEAATTEAVEATADTTTN